jgi:ribonuclease BN (tRNA processing enzyme)
LESFLADAVGDSYLDLFDVVPIEDGSEFSVGGMDFEFRRMEHVVPAFGATVRESGREPGRAGLGYTADTGLCDALWDIARDSSTLLAEAFMQESDQSGRAVGHLSARDAGMVAAKAGVARLILTHLHPENPLEVSLAEARAVFAGDIQVARIGATYDL